MKQPMTDLRGRFDDGTEAALVRLTPMGGDKEFPPCSPHLALHNGEHLVAHPDDRDDTLFLTSNSRRVVRLVMPSPTDRS